jgi:glycosyltransferase involved in cell wall biosynthesis
MELKDKKIALVHDWLLNIGGAEKTLKVLHEIFPSAPIYTLFYNKTFTDTFLPGADIRTTFLQKTRKFIRSHKLLMPLMPIAVESIDLSDFDLVISSSVSFSKGLILKPQTTHICYCYSPMRQVWDWHAEYKSESRKAPKIIVSVFQHFMRIWDRHASTRVDYFIAISKNVQKRIKKYYQATSQIIYPPVVIPNFKTSAATTGLPQDFFLIVSRLFKHKNTQLAVEAFNKLGMPLILIGDGPELKTLKKLASPNITFLGHQPDEVVAEYYKNCLAFIMPQEEDFGLTPLEAMSYGKPVLALKRGGALEYIEEGVNGEFFDDPTDQVLADGVRRIKENLEKYNPAEIKKTAERFSKEEFKKKITILVLDILSRNSTPI